MDHVTNPGQRLMALARASVWTSVALRILGFGAGLLLLAWVGRVATAATPPPQAITDAGPTPIASVAIAAPPAPAAAPAQAPAAAPAQAPPSPPPPAPSSHARATTEDPVYVNQADISELRRLPGVGPKRAEAIVALRQRVGRFQRAEELLRVKGVGRATLRKWRPLLRLDAPAAADAGGATASRSSAT
jgi:competence protein ComEA